MSKRKMRLRPDGMLTRLLAAMIIYPLHILYALKKALV